MQWLNRVQAVRLPDAGALAPCHRLPFRRQALRLPCRAVAAVVDAPVKRKPGRPKKSAEEKVEPATPAAESIAAVPEEKKKRKKKPKKAIEEDNTEDQPEPRAVPPPWAYLSDQQIQQQKDELAVLESQRSRQQSQEPQRDDIKTQARESENNALIHRDTEWLELEKKVFTKTETGWDVDYGCFGEGKLHWYSLNVMSEKKMKDVAMFLTNQAEELPPLQNAPDEPRHFETWLPSKLIKSYNWRTEKMGNKTVKWKYGEKLLVQAVMDDELHDMISENYYVGSYEFSETVADRNGEKYVVPKPCPDEYVDSVQTWLDTPEVRNKEEVMMDEFGEAVKLGGPMSGASNRVDQDKDYVEVVDDESGAKDRRGQPAKLRRYKDDAYRGSYNNPSNWFAGSSTSKESGSSPGTAAPQDRRARTNQIPRGAPASGWSDSGSRGRTQRKTIRVDTRKSPAGPRDAGHGFEDRYASPRDRNSSPTDMVSGFNNRPASTRNQPANPRSTGDSNSGLAGKSEQQDMGWVDPQAAVPKDSSLQAAGSSSAGRFGGSRSILDDGKQFAEQESDFAQEVNLEKAGGDQWEPTGAGRKSWYSPQSPSSFNDAGQPSEALQKPATGLPHRTSQSFSAPQRPSQRQSRVPDADRDSYRSFGDLRTPSGDAETVSRSTESEPQVKSDLNNLQKPVVKGRAGIVTTRSQNGPAALPPQQSRQRGFVKKASSYDPIRKFSRFKQGPVPAPNYFHEDDEGDKDSGNLDLPKFEQLKGDQWDAPFLQFNNVATSTSGSHLDDWKRNGGEDEEQQPDWRAWGRAIRQEEEEQGSQNNGPDGTPLGSEQAGTADLGLQTSNRSSFPEGAPSSSELLSPSPSSPQRTNPFAEGGQFDEWSQADPSFSPRSGSRAGQQRAAPASPKQARSKPNSLHQPAAASSHDVSKGSDSWSTGGFDFDDMDQNAVQFDSRSPRGTSRPIPSRTKQMSSATVQRRPPAGSRSQSRPETPVSNRGHHDSSRRQTSSGTSGVDNDTDFDSVWNK